MRTREEANQKSKQIYEWFMEIRKEFPNVELQKNGDGINYEVYFIGNKTVGDDYSLNCWKTVPILKSKVLMYSFKEEFFLDLRVNYTGNNNSEDWKLDEEKMKNKMRKAFQMASADFLIERV